MPANPYDAPSSNLVVGQVSLTGTAAAIVAARAARHAVIITNTGATTVYLGPTSAVTTGTGFIVASGQAVIWTYEGAVWGIVASSGSVAYSETF